MKKSIESTHPAPGGPRSARVREVGPQRTPTVDATVVVKERPALHEDWVRLGSAASIADEDAEVRDE
jgi:hypothetical protein